MLDNEGPTAKELVEWRRRHCKDLALTIQQSQDTIAQSQELLKRWNEILAKAIILNRKLPPLEPPTLSRYLHFTPHLAPHLDARLILQGFRG